jgi:Rhodopirellula transposase DDE domain
VPQTCHQVGKDNPIERCWGILENHWNGALLDSIEAVIRCAMTMPWKGRGPLVERVTTNPLRPACN